VWSYAGTNIQSELAILMDILVYKVLLNVKTLSKLAREAGGTKR
jgi:hypothetical protein